VLDPAERWRRYHGHEWKPSWAGLLTFADLPYTEDPADLKGVDVAVVGAPTDELVTNAPGTRFGPRAIRAANTTSAYHLEARLDWEEALRVIDYGDAPVVPTDAAASHGAIEATVGEVARAGAMPIVLGGDHSITEPPCMGRSASSTSTRTPTRLRLSTARSSHTAPRCTDWSSGGT
jgi:arginase family enzyme